ncbi:MAG TPA: hypothetical protein VMG12_27200 [Polyangiaceae bacterium]|nr:hypothetical protein [Polyangiaceae bacterium]
MRRSLCTLLFVLGASSAAACGDDGDDGGSRDSTQAICDKGCARAATLACPYDGDVATCVSQCREDLESDIIPEACRPEAIGLLECLADRPVSEWICDENGEATVMEGACAPEMTAAQACVQRSSGSECIFENDDECDDPTGTDLCPAGTDVADCT